MSWRQFARFVLLSSCLSVTLACLAWLILLWNFRTTTVAMAFLRGQGLSASPASVRIGPMSPGSETVIRVTVANPRSLDRL